MRGMGKQRKKEHRSPQTKSHTLTSRYTNVLTSSIVVVLCRIQIVSLDFHLCFYNDPTHTKSYSIVIGNDCMAGHDLWRSCGGGGHT